MGTGITQESVSDFDSYNTRGREEDVSGVFVRCLTRTVERTATSNAGGEVNGSSFAFASAVQIESTPGTTLSEADCAALLGGMTLSDCLELDSEAPIL